jgi:hypothetical protein
LSSANPVLGATAVKAKALAMMAARVVGMTSRLSRKTLAMSCGSPAGDWQCTAGGKPCVAAY